MITALHRCRWKGVLWQKNRGGYLDIEVVHVVRSWILCRVDASWVLCCLLTGIILCVCRRDGIVCEPEKMCMRCLTWSLWGSYLLLLLWCSRQVRQKKKLFCVLGRAGGGVGVILFIFKLSSTNLPRTDALLGWGKPFEAHQENTNSVSSYKVPVLWLSSAGRIQTRTRKCSAL